MMGSRMLKFRGEVLVIDEKNDTMVELSVDQDDRGFFKKMTSKKQTYPDYFKCRKYLFSNLGDILKIN
jgi:hypothetical protein